MSHMAPGEGSPVDNPQATPAAQPYEPQQGSGPAERPQEQVDELQAQELQSAESEEVTPPSAVQGAVGRTDVYGRPIKGDPQPDPEPESQSGSE
jgi:hypothetical protein